MLLVLIAVVVVQAITSAPRVLPSDPVVESSGEALAPEAGVGASRPAPAEQWRPSAGAGPALVGSSPGAAPACAAGAPVDLNVADAAALEALPGVGPVMAARIIEWRMAHGGFRDVRELREVKGIGEKTFRRLSTLVRV